MHKSAQHNQRTHESQTDPNYYTTKKREPPAHLTSPPGALHRRKAGVGTVSVHDRP